MLIFNPSCLAHGGHWPQLQGPATPSWKGLGGDMSPRCPWGHCVMAHVPWGSPAGGLGQGDVGTGLLCLCPEGEAMVRAVPPALPQTAAAAARECPGRRDPGLKANRRRRVGWEKGRKPRSHCPIPPGAGGSAAWREPGQGWQRETLTQTSPVWGLRSGSHDAKGHQGHPAWCSPLGREKGKWAQWVMPWGGWVRATEPLELQWFHLQGPRQARGWFFLLLFFPLWSQGFAWNSDAHVVQNSPAPTSGAPCKSHLPVQAGQAPPHSHRFPGAPAAHLCCMEAVPEPDQQERDRQEP